MASKQQKPNPIPASVAAAIHLPSDTQFSAAVPNDPAAIPRIQMCMCSFISGTPR